MVKRHFIYVLAISAAGFFVVDKSKSQNQVIDVYGWPVVSDPDTQQMMQNQVEYNRAGDVARNLASPAQAAASAAQGPEELAQNVVEGFRDDAIEKSYANQASQGPFNALENLAKSYLSASRSNTAEAADINNDDARITRDRAAYNDVSLCRSGLLLCNRHGLFGIFGNTVVCANNVLDPTANSGRRVIGVVEVECDGRRTKVIRRQWGGGGEYIGPETERCADGFCFRGNLYSSYCEPCR